MWSSSSEPDPDYERFTQWVAEYGGYVRGYLLSLARNSDVAEEIAQETFYRAWVARDRYKECGNARAYLIRIADRLLIDHQRRVMQTPKMMAENEYFPLESAPGRTPSQELEYHEMVNQLNQAMKLLSPVQQRVLTLRYFGQLGFLEIAEIVQVPLGTVLSHARRGLLALRDIMGHHSQNSEN